jgi:hypothetical protein
MTETPALERRDFSEGENVCMAIVGPHGAVHYWHRIAGFSFSREGEKYGGVEIHYRNKVDYIGDIPSHEHCKFIDAPCWHDGSSLYADEVFTPFWESCNRRCDMESFWKRLEEEYLSRFEVMG